MEIDPVILVKHKLKQNKTPNQVSPGIQLYSV